MARQESKNTPKGRMLFTDFDASQMRRPLHAAMPVDPPQTSVLPSLEEVASRIDITFEEDDADFAGDGDGKFHPPPPLFRQARTAKPAHGAVAKEEPEDSPRDDFSRFSPNSEYSEYEEGGARVYPAFHAHVEASMPHYGNDGHSGEIVMDAADQSAAFGDEDDFGNLDILAVVPPEPAGEKSGMGLRIKHRPESAPPDRPYGGIERVKDWFQPPEDSSYGRNFPQAAEDVREPPEDDVQESAGESAPSLDGKPNRRSTPSLSIENREDAEDLFAEFNQIVAENAPNSAFYGSRRKKDVDSLGSGRTTIIFAPKFPDHIAEPENGDKRDKGITRIVASPGRNSAEDGEAPPIPADSRKAGGNNDIAASDLSGENAAAFEQSAEDNVIAFLDEVTLPAGPKPAPKKSVSSRGASAIVVNNEGNIVNAGSAEADGDGDSDGDRNVPGESDPELDAALPEPELDLDDDYLPGEPDAGEPAAVIPMVNDDDLIDYSRPEERRKSTQSKSADDKVENSAEEAGDTPDIDPETAPQDEAAVAVDPLDVFAKLDAIDDFGDGGLDDEMQAMLAEDAEKDGDDEIPPEPPPTEEEPSPGGWRGVIAVIKKTAGRGIGKILPAEFFRQMASAAAFRENWRFYCDLLAALIATASLAVIVSYFLWFR